MDCPTTWGSTSRIRGASLLFDMRRRFENGWHGTSTWSIVYWPGVSDGMGRSMAPRCALFVDIYLVMTRPDGTGDPRSVSGGEQIYASCMFAEKKGPLWQEGADGSVTLPRRHRFFGLCKGNHGEDPFEPNTYLHDIGFWGWVHKRLQIARMKEVWSSKTVQSLDVLIE